MEVYFRKMKILKNKKGQAGVLDQLGALGVGIATLAITLIVVFLILSNVGANTQVAADANATAAVVELSNATDDVVDWVPLVIIVVIGALILGLIAVFRR